MRKCSVLNNVIQFSLVPLAQILILTNIQGNMYLASLK